MSARIFKYILLLMLLLAFTAGSSVMAASSNLTASAIVLSKNQCRFMNNKFTLDFGNIVPISGAAVNASATVNFRCQGSTPIASYSISEDDGLHSTGPGLKRMQHSVDGTQYVPYSLTLSPTSGNVPKNTPQILTVDGTINGPDYQFAIPGTYADLVVISILP